MHKDREPDGEIAKAIVYLAKALRYDSSNAETWYHYGGANYSTGNYNEAYRSWAKCLKINPNNTEAQKGMSVLIQQMNHAGQPSGGTNQAPALAPRSRQLENSM